MLFVIQMEFYQH